MYNVTKTTIEEELIKSLLAPTEIERFGMWYDYNITILKSKYENIKDFKINKNIKDLILDLEKLV